MKFGKALKLLQNGGSVHREGWDSGYRVLIYCGRLCMRDSTGDIGSWSMTSETLLANDWEAVDAGRWPVTQFSQTIRQDDVTMKFGKALKMLQQGHLLQRKGWNGADMYVYLVPRFGSMPQYLRMKTADDKHVPWTISQTDALANDWVTTEAP